MNQQGRSSGARILVSPLDWGLGHATRCIPVIKELLTNNCTVLLAAQGKIKLLLKTEFPQVEILDLPGYNMEYSARRWTLPFSIVAQVPKLLSAIDNERKWLQQIVNQHDIDAVISDNRFGLSHPRIRCVFITHQLRIKLPVKKAENFLQSRNYGFINQFDECWVPDLPTGHNLAGELSHPARMPETPVKYIGALSRFSHVDQTTGKHLLILLSGPEPQRTIFENKIVLQLRNYQLPVVLVRGLPGEAGQLNVPPGVTVFNHLPAGELEQQIREATYVISRCGYSTVMDLSALKKKAIFIPTPGQTEQEYLGKYLMLKNFAPSFAQEKFTLRPAMDLARNYPYTIDDFHDPQALSQTIKNFLSSL